MVGDAVQIAGARRHRVPLTRQERDILAVSARGAGVSEVASELGLSEREVREALAAAVCKLGARSKLEAVLVALRWGEIVPRGPR
jgi:two-component system response regulator DesR